MIPQLGEWWMVRGLGPLRVAGIDRTRVTVQRGTVGGVLTVDVGNLLRLATEADVPRDGFDTTPHVYLNEADDMVEALCWTRGLRLGQSGVEWAVDDDATVGEGLSPAAAFADWEALR